MKKHLLLSCCATFFLFLFSSSQVLSKKDKLFGISASIGYSYVNEPPSTGDTRHYNNVGLVPSFAWAIKDNVVLGIKGNLAYSRMTNYVGGEKRVYTALAVGPELYIRKYRTLREHFGIFFNHGISGYYSNTKNKIPPDVFKTALWGGGYNFTPGAFYKFSDRFLGEANIGGLFLGYSKNNNGYKNFTAAANFLNYFNIGINLIIPGKKS